MSSRSFSITFILSLFLILPGCDNTISSTEYVPGQIAVGFVDSVSYKFVVNLCNSSNLGIIKLDLGHNFWAKADSNDLEYYKKIFLNDSSVVHIDKLYTGSSEDTLLITITFTGINTIKYDMNKVESAGLNVYDIHVHPKTALLKTTIGQEKYWINTLSRYDFITFAELNYVMHAF